MFKVLCVISDSLSSLRRDVIIKINNVVLFSVNRTSVLSLLYSTRVYLRLYVVTETEVGLQTNLLLVCLVFIRKVVGYFFSINYIID